MSAIAAITYGGTVAVTLTPAAVNGYIAGGATVNVTTGAALASPAGVAPYTYAWTQVGVSPYTWTINAPTAASTSFTAVSLPQGVSATAVFRVTVTDAAGASGHADVTATALNDTYVFTGPFS